MSKLDTVGENVDAVELSETEYKFKDSQIVGRAKDETTGRRVMQELPKHFKQSVEWLISGNGFILNLNLDERIRVILRLDSDTEAEFPCLIEAITESKVNGDRELGRLLLKLRTEICFLLIDFEEDDATA